MQKQNVIDVVFDRFVATVNSIVIARAMLPVLCFVAAWSAIFSEQFARDDAELQLQLALADLRPITSLPSFLAYPSAEAISEASVTAAAPIYLTNAQKNLVTQLAGSYRVGAQDLSRYVVGAYRAARDLKVDPILVLAIMSIESSFNPMAQSHAGAQGLMQVLTRVHQEKFEPFGGSKAAFDIDANIHVGTRIIKEYLQREGSVEGALKSYVGAALMSDDGGYGWKVMAQMQRLKAIAAGKPIPNIPDRRPDVELVAQSGDLPKLLGQGDTITNKASVDGAQVVPVSYTPPVTMHEPSIRYTSTEEVLLKEL